jgi:hypothetical protein
MDWTYGGVLESYNVTNCDQYPTSNYVTYSGISIHQLGGGYVSPSWINSIEPRTPQCVTCMSSNATQVTIGLNGSNVCAPPPPPSNCETTGCGEGLVCCDCTVIHCVTSRQCTRECGLR